MKNIKYYIFFAAVIALFVYFFNGSSCEGSQPVQTPEVKTHFDAVKPEIITLHDTIPDPSQKAKYEALLSKYSAVISKLKTENKLLTDSVAIKITKDTELAELIDSMFVPLSAYQKAISINGFKETFKNDKVQLTVSGITKGTLESIGIDEVIIPPMDCPKVKVPVFTLLAGFEVGGDSQGEHGTAKLNIGFQNAKRNVFTLSYQRIGSSEYYLGGFSKNVWTVKK